MAWSENAVLHGTANSKGIVISFPTNVAILWISSFLRHTQIYYGRYNIYIHTYTHTLTHVYDKYH